MQAICKISHEQIVMETGGFRRYEAGQEYDVDSPDPAYFEIKGTVPDLRAEQSEAVESGPSPSYKKGGKK